MANICPECGDKIIGRSDKKFCSDHCRNSYNNRKNKDRSKLVRDVNSILMKNHHILKDLFSDGIDKIHRDKLLRKGFNFDFITSITTTNTNTTTCYCYDMGFCKLENDLIGLVKQWQILDE